MIRIIIHNMTGEHVIRYSRSLDREFAAIFTAQRSRNQ